MYAQRCPNPILRTARSSVRARDPSRHGPFWPTRGHLPGGGPSASCPRAPQSGSALPHSSRDLSGHSPAHTALLRPLSFSAAGAALAPALARGAIGAKLGRRRPNIRSASRQQLAIASLIGDSLICPGG